MPIYSVQGPDGRIYDVEGPAGASEEQIIGAVRRQYLMASGPSKPSQDTTGFKAAAAAGFERLKGETALTAGKIGLMDIAEAEKYQKEREAAAQARFTPTEEGWTEAPFQKFKETLGGSLPYMAAPVAAGLGALAAPVAAPTAAVLGAGLAGLTSAGQFTGSNLARQMGTGKSLEETSLGSAVGAAIPQAALDTAAMALMPGVGKLFGSVGAKLTTAQAEAIAKQTLGRAAADYAAKTGVAMGREGLTETAQQVLERVQAGLAIDDPEARKEYIDSFIGGAALAGVGAPVGRAIERSAAKTQAEEAQRGRIREQRMADEAVAKEEAAAEEARKQTPEYALQVEQEYLAAEQQKAALKAQIKKGTKEEPLNEADKAANADINAQLKELQPTVKALGQEFNRTAKTRAQAQEQARVAGMDPFDYMMEQTGEVSTRKVKPVEDTAYEESGLAFQEPVMPEKPLTPEQKLQQYVAERAALVQDQLPAPEVKDYVDYLLQDPTMADQMVKTRTKMPDLTRQENETVLSALKLQLKARDKAEQEQRAAESARLQTAGQTRLAGVEEEEQAALAQAEAERQAAAAEAQREAALGGERFSLQKMRAAQGAPQNVFDETAPYSLGPKLSDQFGLFGEEQAAPTPGIAPIGQMRQKLLGEDVTFTAEEAEATKKRDLRRVPGAEFKLRGRAEGTGAPVTRDELADRINTVLSTYDLSPEAVELLQRVEKALPQKLSTDYALALDEQLGLIESGQEGVPRKGAERPATLQAFPAQGARAEAAAPTEAYKYETQSLRSAQPGQAQTTGRRVAQPEGERVATEAGEVPVQKQISDITPRTLRGESAAPAPLSALEADRRKERNPLVDMLRTAEAAAAEDAGQMALFPAEDKKLGTIKETPEALSRVQDAPTARKVRKELREAEAAKKAETPAEKARAEQGAKDAELLQYKRDLSDARAKYINDVLEQQRVFAERAKDLPGDGGQARIRRVRALSEIERDARESGLTADAAQGVQYKNALYNKDAGWLLREIGKVEKRFREITDQVKAAKKKSASYTGDAAMVKAFKGQASAIRAQSRLSVQLAALNNAYDLRSGAAQPRVTSALRVADKERVRPEEREEVEAEIERAQTFGIRQERLNALKEKLAAAQKSKKAPAVQSLSEAIIKAEAELAEVAPKPLQGKVTQASRVQTSAPGKLRAGTEESKKATGSVKRPVVEGRTEKLPTAKQVVEEGNIASLLKQASEKPKTVAELKALSIQQDRAVTEAQQRLVDNLRIQKNKLEEEVRALEALQAKGATRVSAETLKTKNDQLRQVNAVFNRADKNLTKYYNATLGSTKVSDVEGTEMRGTPSRTMKLFDEDDGFSGSMYRVSTTKGKGTTPERLAAIIKKMTGDWKNVPTIVMAETYDALPDNIKAQAEADGVAGYIPGVYDSDNNTVYLVAENLPTDEDIYATVAHEIAGHYGLRSMLGADYTKTMDDIYNGNADVRKKADAKLERIPSLSQQTATEEVLADMAENAPAEPKGALRQLYDRIKRWFRETLGFDKMTDKAVQQIVENARKYVIEGTGGKGGQAPQTTALYRAKTPKYSSDALAAAGNTAGKVIAGQRSLTETVKQEGLGMGLATRLVDRFAPLEKASKMMDSLKGTQMMYYARMFDQKMHFLSQAVSNGAIGLEKKTRADGKSEWVIESKEGASIKGVVDILKDAKSIVGSVDGVSQLFSLYTVAKRAERVGLNKMNFGNAVNEAELKSALKAINDTPGLAKIFENARQEYNAFNKGMVQFAVDTGALSKDVAAKMLKSDDYVPFYRERNGGVEMVLGNETIAKIGNLKNQPYLKELVGGEDRIIDFMTSSVQNANMLTDMALRNLSTKSAAFELRDIGMAKIGKGTASGTDVVNFKDGGEDFHAIIDTTDAGFPADLLVKGMEGIPYQTTWLTKGLGIPANILRKAVTLNPVYAARQLFRDSLAAPLLSGADFKPIIGALKEINGTAKKTLERRGITGGQVFTGTQDDMADTLRRLTAGESGWLQGVAKLEALSMEADALTRRAQYNSYIQQGLSEMEATYAALESMNFSKRGSSPAMHFLSTVIPFFNAQIQGLNVLYKAFTGDMPFNEKLKVREKLLQRGALLAAGTMVYAVLMQDDETYESATPEQKYGNWFIHVPGFDEAVKLPIPFEIGYIFKALPEALVNMMAKEEGGEEALKALKQIVLQTIPGGSSYGIPQAIKPLIEVGLGKSFYTGRDLESAYEQSMVPGKRTRDNTTDFARTVGDMFNVSPIKIDALIQGYTSSTGLALVQALSFAIPTPPSPDRAALRASEIPLVGGLFQPKDAGGIINAAYERMNEAKQVKTTFDGLMEKGRPEEAREFLQENLDKFANAGLATNFTTTMQKLSQAERAIRASNLSPDQKREQLDRIKQTKIKIAEAVRAAGRTTPQ